MVAYRWASWCGHSLMKHSPYPSSWQCWGLRVWLLKWRWKLAAVWLIAAFICAAYWLWTDKFGDTQKASTLVNLLYTALTGLLVLVAIAQIDNSQAATRSVLEGGAEQRRKWATLQACDRYDMDREITSAVRFLRRYHAFDEPRLKAPTSLIANSGTSGKSGSDWDGISDDQRYTMSAGLLLNYFDSIAIGIAQKFYDDSICREHIGPIVAYWMAMIRAANAETFDEVMEKNYRHTAEMHDRWTRGVARD